VGRIRLPGMADGFHTGVFFCFTFIKESDTERVCGWGRIRLPRMADGFQTDVFLLLTFLFLQKEK
ncbi:hypothetical protein, partial [Butyricicoccus sp.]|uniref:hypothetical protein n=1 Tax=Butyricicoccus sp. TaxID=2049021 RepID=UPI003F16E674